VDFFEEIAKFRAARRIWARWLRERYGATSPNALWLRFHTQTAGVSLTAQQPVNNVVRTAIEALAAVLGGTNSLHTNALDETLALPTDESAEIALRTQQVIMEESGVMNVADPLGGSWYVEALTDKIEAEAERVFERILAMGGGQGTGETGPMTSGILRGIEDGWFMAEIADASFAYQQAVEKGAKKVVGVNVHTATVAPEVEILRISHEVELTQREELAKRRSRRDSDAVTASIKRMVAAAGAGENLIPSMMDAARAEATLGEICDALRDIWGTYREPARF
jgi:methylmalonyl-CoA mutase N-terminal domain/subunit